MAKIALVFLEWSIVLRSKLAQLREDWHKKPISVLLLYIFTAMLWYWEWNIPSPGKGVAAMAVAAALMSLRGEMEGKEKLAWICLLFGFLFVELTSIDTERKSSEESRALARAQEAESFNKIGHGINNSIFEAKKSSAATGVKIEQAINNTLPQAYIVMESIKPTGHVDQAPGVAIPLEIDYKDTGLDVAKNLVTDQKTFIAPFDDKDSQIQIGKEFDSWWPTSPKQKRHMNVQPQEPKAEFFQSQALGDDDLKRIVNHEATLYVLARWVYADSRGKWWVNDDCEAYYDISTHMDITLPCQVHNNHRYPMPKSMMLKRP